MADLTNKQFLDKDGLSALWSRIQTTFAPRWVSYKPSNTQTQHNNLNIESEDVNALQTTDEVYIINTAAGQLRDSSGNLVNGKDILLHIPAAAGSNAAGGAKAGVMSASDKVKLDSIESTAENAVTLKNILIGGGDDNVEPTRLTLSTQTNINADDYKSVAFGLNYNADSDLLSIMDLNYKPDPENKPNEIVPRALSSVHILGDALKNAFIHSAKIVDKDDQNNSGTFIEIVFVTQTQDPDYASNDTPKSNSTQTVYINVSDLIDIYSEGNGITITETEVDPDDTKNRTSTISLKTAGIGSGDDKIGGIKVYASNVDAVTAKTSSQAFDATSTSKNDNRFLGIELDKNGQAYVYNPVEDVEVVTVTPTEDGGTIAHEGEFTAITGLEVNVDEYSGKITISETPTKFKLPAETKLSKGTDKTQAPTITPLKYGSTFTAVVDTEVSDHTITDVNTTWTLPSLNATGPGAIAYGDPKSNTQIIAAPVNTDTPPEPHISIPVITNIGLTSDDSGNITLSTVQERYDYWVDVKSIPLTDIAALAYPTY